MLGLLKHSVICHGVTISDPGSLQRDFSLTNKSIAGLAKRNVKAIARIEATLVGQRTAGARLIRWLIRHIGSPTSAAIHGAFVVGWVTLNGIWLPPASRLDPPPFAVLALAASAESLLVGILILASQNRLQHEEDQRSHLNLQVSMLAETESTKIIHMLDRISIHLGLEVRIDDDLDELKTDTDHEAIVETLQTSMPKDR